MRLSVLYFTLIKFRQFLHSHNWQKYTSLQKKYVQICGFIYFGHPGRELYEEAPAECGLATPHFPLKAVVEAPGQYLKHLGAIVLSIDEL